MRCWSQSFLPIETPDRVAHPQVETLVEKQGRLQELLAKLQKSLELTEDQLAKTNTDIKVLSKEQEAADRASSKIVLDIRGMEEEMLEALNQQTTVEKSSTKTTSDIRNMRKRVRDEELAVAEMQNELARLQIEIVNTESANDRLKVRPGARLPPAARTFRQSM